MALTILLSLVAAALFAVAAVFQQQGAATIDDDDALGAGMLAALARRPIWLLGMLADIAGFGVQAWALAVGSLLLVQPLLVTTLLVALPLGARFAKRSLSAEEWGWSALLVGALVAFVILGQPTAGINQPSFGSWIPVLMVCVPLIAAFVVVGGSKPHGTKRSLYIAIAAGLLLGLSAPLTKGAVHGFSGGFVDGVVGWELWAMAITASLGTFWQQSSYQAGDVQTSLPTVTVLKPVVAMAIGLTIYQEHLVISGFVDILLFVAIGAMIYATVQLSNLAAPAMADSDADDASSGDASASTPVADGPTPAVEPPAG